MTCSGTCYKITTGSEKLPRGSPCLASLARLNRTDSSWQGNRSFTQIQGQPFTFLSRSTQRALTVINYHAYHLISKAETPVWALKTKKADPKDTQLIKCEHRFLQLLSLPTEHRVWLQRYPQPGVKGTSHSWHPINSIIFLQIQLLEFFTVAHRQVRQKQEHSWSRMH